MYNSLLNTIAVMSQYVIKCYSNDYCTTGNNTVSENDTTLLNEYKHSHQNELSIVSWLDSTQHTTS